MSISSRTVIATLLISCLLIASLNALSLERRMAKAIIKELRQQLTKYSESSDSQSFWPETRCTAVENALNVRSTPGGNLVKTLGPETQVTVYETSNVNGVKWARIGDNQWVSAQFLKMACQEAYSGPDSKTGDKAAETLAEIFKSEGRCQNWASDSGNSFQGKIGYTCMGVTPSECWNNRDGSFAPFNNGFSGHPADFCYYAYNQNPSIYKSCAAQLYAENYFGPGGCSNLPMPAFYVCSDIAVNSGTGRSRQYLNEFGGYKGQDPKAFARQLNERHRADYLVWGRPGTANNKFLQGWLNRANDRAEYIDNY